MKLRIEQDSDAQSPGEWENAGLFLVAEHRDFYVPAPGEKRASVQSAIEEYAASHWQFRLSAYIHSGVVLKLGNGAGFPDWQWDVSQVGAVFVDKNEWPDKANAIKAAESLVAEWNQYLSGDVWGYVIEDDQGNQVDSCWGFYGRDYCEKEGQAAMKYSEKEYEQSDALATA